MDLTILIISYNTRELTVACLRSVYEQTRELDFEVIVLDNQSSDGSADAIAQQFPQVKLIRAAKNLGFAGGNNEAADQAKGEYLLLLNPDTVVIKGAIQNLYSFARAHSEATIFGGRTFFPDNSLNPASCWRRPTPWSAFCIAAGLSRLFPHSEWFNSEAFGAWPRDSVREVDIISGCFFLIRRDLWEQLGGFDPAFFMYGEEADLCLRAKKIGHRCLVCPDATIVHYGGASEKVRADKMVKLFTAKAQLLDRHWISPWRRFGILCLDLWAITRMGAFLLLKYIRPGRAESYRTWRDIWLRRSEWHNLPSSILPVSPRKIAKSEQALL
ncbi:MAG TPA: glycosyltransferase family 2 protein [Tepidisphaeraceae bacterium]|nr:glycosyltransferase family 2 protein [Tepidisphaeraceae bacterium]